MPLLVILSPATRVQYASITAANGQEEAVARLDEVAVKQALLDLNSFWTVMCIAAHPDDEDGTSLTVLRHKYGVHTVSVFSTYGEGGQNAVGPELYEELGVIRARETMAAAEIQGSEPYFLGLKDFGFSKSADEAFHEWGHEIALRRMVQKIRELRPDVIITNHDTTSGHGHHQATGRLLLEAFDVAADSQRFADQLKNGVQPWQVKRIFVRARGGTGDSAGLVSIDPNERDSVRGTSFAEQALQALQKHQTQGPWPKTIADMARFRNSSDGRLPLIRYRLTREAKDTQPLPKDATTFVDGLTLPEQEAARLKPPKIEGQPLSEFTGQPDRILAALIEARKNGVFGSNAGDDSARFRLMNGRLDRALAALTGTTLSVSTNDTALVPGIASSFSVNLANGGSHELGVTALSLTSDRRHAIDVADTLLPDTETTKAIDITIPARTPVSVPEDRHLYDGRLFGERFVAQATLAIEGAKFELTTPVLRNIAPAVEIQSISPVPYVWTPATGTRPLSFKVSLTNHLTNTFNGTLSVTSPTNRIIGAGQKLSLNAGESREVALESSALSLDVLKAHGTGQRRSLSESGSINVAVRNGAANKEITSDSVEIVHADARVVPKLKVGFVPSFDETIETSLKALGVDSAKLTPAEVQKSDLTVYATLIIDNRGYEAHPELIAANDRLLNFVHEGGTLIVFYHKDNEWNPNANRPQLAPYPIVLGGERVTDENAPVTFLKPGHQLLNFPNKLGPADFTGWIQERGLYYPREWDDHYSALFAMNDPGEQPLKGGLLVASYGRGEYIYTSMVWYRELRAGLPGAYRMLANMVSYGHR